jgi:RNase P/RNase MRP subunit POP5
VSPRKSSTSSAEPVERPRYLGLEVAGVAFVPRPWLERALRDALPPALEDHRYRRPRIVRLERSRAVVEVGHRWAAVARKAWNGPMTGPQGSPVEVSTRRTWGTLRGAKVWLRSR